MQVQATDILRGEHEHILRACAILERMAARVGDVDASDATAIVDFVRFYADGMHHAKEENVLFPALEAAGMPRRGGPIGVMLGEHERGREHVGGMLDAVTSFHTVEGRTAFADSARGFAALLEHHIAKENNVLFMMADRLLGRGDETPLLEAYAARDVEKATHESILAELSQRRRDRRARVLPRP
jgi:hemerythrin-like domain-containing protein